MIWKYLVNLKKIKTSFISDEMFIVGCGIVNETHYIRAIDVRGRELSKGAFEFSNTSTLNNKFLTLNIYTSIDNIWV